MLETQNVQALPPARYKSVKRAPPGSLPTSAGAGMAIPPVPVSARERHDNINSPPSKNSASPPRNGNVQLCKNAGNAEDSQLPPSAVDSMARSRSRYRRRTTGENPGNGGNSIGVQSSAPPLPALPPLNTKNFQSSPVGSNVTSPQKPHPTINTITPGSAQHSQFTSPINTTNPEFRPAADSAQEPKSPLEMNSHGSALPTDRMITVQVGQETLTLPVNKDSTAETLANAVCNIIPKKTIMGASMFLESFKGLGLVRQVRVYERVRDIMNSWEDDTKNTLVLISLLAAGSFIKLEDAPLEPPSDYGSFLYYMYKPSKWVKKWVVLRDGTLYMSKKETDKDKNLQTICHLDDFDLYDACTPQSVGYLKVPRQHFFAVKSQQKASLFVSSQDWVHYFSTKDKEVYSSWCSLVKSYRSWYLVHKKGYGPKPDVKPPSVASSTDVGGGTLLEQQVRMKATAVRPGTSHASGANPNGGPLISQNELSKPAPFDVQRSKSLKASGRHGGGWNGYEAPPIPTNDSAIFAPDGLLGRTYSIKLKGEEVEKAYQEGFNDALKKMGEMSVSRSKSVRSHKRNSSLEPIGPAPARTHTMKHTQRPLLEFAAPPVPSSMPPERNPPSRYRSRTVNEHGAHHGAVGFASRPGTRGNYDPNNPFYDGAGNPFTDTNAAFTGGLLAQLPTGVGAMNTGHGVQRGLTVNGTLLDVRNETVFAQGSLLARVQQEQNTGYYNGATPNHTGGYSNGLGGVLHKR